MMRWARTSGFRAVGAAATTVGVAGGGRWKDVEGLPTASVPGTVRLRLLSLGRRARRRIHHNLACARWVGTLSVAELSVHVVSALIRELVE